MNRLLLIFTLILAFEPSGYSQKRKHLKNNVKTFTPPVCCIIDEEVVKPPGTDHIISAHRDSIDIILPREIKNVLMDHNLDKIFRKLRGTTLYYGVKLDTLGHLLNVDYVMDYPYRKIINRLVIQVIQRHEDWQPAYILLENNTKLFINWTETIGIKL